MKDHQTLRLRRLGIDTLVDDTGQLALWIAGRLAPFAPGAVPGWLIAAVDVAFLPALAASLAVPLLRSRQWHNLPFVPVLLLLAFANALVHLDVLGVAPGRGRRACISGSI